MRSFLIAAVLAACSAVAVASDVDAMIYQNGDLAVRLTSAPCDREALAAPLAKHGKPKTAVTTFQGRVVSACWVRVGGDQILIFDEDGDAGLIDVLQFRRDV